MQEIELKILNINVVDITARLTRLGATPEGTNLIVEKAFDFKNKSISRRKELLRLRKVGEKTELAYKSSKGKTENFRIVEEIQTTVHDFAATETILEKMGLKCIKHREKHRTSFVLENTRFEIDEYPGIPAYLEIEGEPEHIKKYVALLGFTLKDTVNTSSTKVLKKYKVKHDFLTFAR